MFELIGGAFNSGGSSGASGAGLSGLFSSGFSGFHADGGTIPAGSWGIVGERGPEPAFVGNMPLSVMPNALARSVSGGATHAATRGRLTRLAQLHRLQRPDATLLAAAIARGRRNL